MGDGGVKAPEHRDRQRAFDVAASTPSKKAIRAVPFVGNFDWQLRQLIGFRCRIGKPINRFCGFI